MSVDRENVWAVGRNESSQLSSLSSVDWRSPFRTFIPSQKKRCLTATDGRTRAVASEELLRESKGAFTPTKSPPITDVLDIRERTKNPTNPPPHRTLLNRKKAGGSWSGRTLPAFVSLTSNCSCRFRTIHHQTQVTLSYPVRHLLLLTAETVRELRDGQEP